jgi:hypothetical protein
MTSKSASAALADGDAFSSRSRSSWAALDVTEKPRIRSASGRGVCADNQTIPIVEMPTEIMPMRE